MTTRALKQAHAFNVESLLHCAATDSSGSNPVFASPTSRTSLLSPILDRPHSGHANQPKPVGWAEHSDAQRLPRMHC
jgi:hypothetical protein